MDYDGGEYGEAVLSKHRLLETRALALPHRPGSEPRAAAVVRVRPDGFASDLTLLATHLDHLEDESDRVAQARELLRVGGELGKAALLAGDLNALPESAPMRLLLADWRDTAPPQAPATWPSHEPTQRIDYVLVPRGGPWGVVESQVLEEQVASDHRPLLVVLERKGED
jgi:endonuclease/exonuclease/phosphatase family metal-dependent hydrolase